MNDPEIISDVAAEIDAGRAALRELERDVARLVPESIRAIDVCQLKKSIVELIGIIDRCGDAIVEIHHQQREQAAKEAAEAARKASDLKLAEMPEASAKDGRSIQRRCTEALFANRQPAP